MKFVQLFALSTHKTFYYIFQLLNYLLRTLFILEENSATLILSEFSLRRLPKGNKNFRLNFEVFMCANNYVFSKLPICMKLRNNNYFEFLFVLYSIWHLSFE